MTVAQPPTTQLGNAGVVLQRGKHIMQRLAGGHMHAHIATGHHGYSQFLSQCLQGKVALHLVVAQQVTHTQPQALLTQPLELQTVGIIVFVIIVG